MLTTYGKQFCLKKLFGETVPARSSNYLGLGFGSDIDGITNELTATGYARTEILTSAWTVGNAQLLNATSVNLSTTTASFGSPTSWGIFDAATGGNCLFYGLIDPTQEIAAGQQIYFPPGELNLSLSTVTGGYGLTVAWANNFLSDIVGKTNTTVPTLYLGFSNDDNIATTITGETFTGGYERLLFGSTLAVAMDGTKAKTANSTTIDFTVTGDWGTNIARMFLATHATDALEENLVYVGAIASISPAYGDIVEVNPSGFITTLE